MPNYKIWTDNELKFLKEKYQIIHKEEEKTIEVSFKNYGRKTYHPDDKGFFILVKDLNNKKITFTTETVLYWKDPMLKNKNIFDIQMAINKLKATYQKVNAEAIRDVLEKDSLKIQKI